MQESEFVVQVVELIRAGSGNEKKILVIDQQTEKDIRSQVSLNIQTQILHIPPYITTPNTYTLSTPPPPPSSTHTHTGRRHSSIRCHSDDSSYRRFNFRPLPISSCPNTKSKKDHGFWWTGWSNTRSSEAQARYYARGRAGPGGSCGYKLYFYRTEGRKQIWESSSQEATRLAV